MNRNYVIVRDKSDWLGRSLIRSCSAPTKIEAIKKCEDNGFIFVKFIDGELA